MRVQHFAASVIYCIYVIHLIGAVNVKIRIDREDGKPVEYFEEDLTEEDFQEKPPFEMVDRDKRASYDDRPPVVHSQSRFKRSDSETDFNVRREPDCSVKMDEMVEKNKNKPIQLAYVLEPGENIKLMCHFCGDPANYRAVIEWKRLIRQTSADGSFLIETVYEDFHDIPALNRISFTTDLSLVIYNVTKADADTYFCIDASRDTLVEAKMNAYGMNRMFTAHITKETFRLYYHLDIIKTSDIPARKVTGMDRLLENEQDYARNLEYFTNWQKWGSCSVCGKLGEQKRRGVCTVRLMDENHFGDPVYIYYALSSFKKGIPCRSTMFNVFGQNFARRPDEIEIRLCNMSCKADFSAHKFSRLDVEDIHFTGLNKAFPVDVVNVTEEGSAIIKCKGATLDDVVYWLNNSEYMTSFSVSQNSSGRVDIDVYGNLRITDARMYDAGMLECWVRMKKTRAVRFIVTPKDPHAWKRHLMYLMYTYFINFCVFLALMFVKHYHRQTQTVSGTTYYRQQKKKKAAAGADLDEDEEYYDNYYVENDTNANACTSSEDEDRDVRAWYHGAHVGDFHDSPTYTGDAPKRHTTH
uniref:Uncharacterized protein LOC111104675 n=1 Tax=Crassostrea virginica TaxID=6565 RepID=A0A8B8AUU7_CRAVI|nr:uncharacterized protein LOC111104675 [Crassostrea virginica]